MENPTVRSNSQYNKFSGKNKIKSSQIKTHLPSPGRNKYLIVFSSSRGRLEVCPHPEEGNKGTSPCVREKTASHHLVKNGSVRREVVVQQSHNGVI